MYDLNTPNTNYKKYTQQKVKIIICARCAVVSLYRILPHLGQIRNHLCNITLMIISWLECQKYFTLPFLGRRDRPGSCEQIKVYDQCVKA